MALTAWLAYLYVWSVDTSGAEASTFSSLLHPEPTKQWALWNLGDLYPTMAQNPPSYPRPMDALWPKCFFQTVGF